LAFRLNKFPDEVDQWLKDDGELYWRNRLLTYLEANAEANKHGDKR
jgi:hypothetical protein